MKNLYAIIALSSIMIFSLSNTQANSFNVHINNQTTPDITFGTDVDGGSCGKIHLQYSPTFPKSGDKIEARQHERFKFSAADNCGRVIPAVD